MNNIAMFVLVAICVGITWAVGWKGHARALLLSSGVLLAALAFFSLLDVTIPFHFDRSIFLIVGIGLAVAGVADLLFQRLIKRWRS